MKIRKILQMQNSSWAISHVSIAGHA